MTNWIKLSKNIFQDEKIKLLKSCQGKEINIIIWLMVLVTVDAQGLLKMENGIPYTDEMLATIFDYPKSKIQNAMKLFQDFGMVDIKGNSYHLVNWDKYQDIDKLEELRRQNRERVNRHRNNKRQKNQNSDVTQSNANCNVTGNGEVMQSNAIEVEVEKEEDKEVDITAVAVIEDDDNDEEENGDILCPFGKAQVVMLTDNQIDDLLDKMDRCTFDYYIDRLSKFIVSNNANVKSHYKTILKWWKEDTQVSV